jgi:hypothetical protein
VASNAEFGCLRTSVFGQVDAGRPRWSPPEPLVGAGRVLLRRDVDDGSQQAQLQRRGLLGHDLGGLGQLRRSL